MNKGLEKTKRLLAIRNHLRLIESLSIIPVSNKKIFNIFNKKDIEYSLNLKTDEEIKKENGKAQK